MEFMFSELVCDRILNSLGIIETENWFNRIKDDFNENVSNDWLMNRLLVLNPKKLIQIVDNDLEVAALINDFRNSSWSEADIYSASIRLRVFAYIMVNDAIAFTKYQKAWRLETRLFCRFTHVDFYPNRIKLCFEGYDE